MNFHFCVFLSWIILYNYYSFHSPFVHPSVPGPNHGENAWEICAQSSAWAKRNLSKSAGCNLLRNSQLEKHAVAAAERQNKEFKKAGGTFLFTGASYSCGPAVGNWKPDWQPQSTTTIHDMGLEDFGRWFSVCKCMYIIYIYLRVKYVCMLILVLLNMGHFCMPAWVNWSPIHSALQEEKKKHKKKDKKKDTFAQHHFRCQSGISGNHPKMSYINRHFRLVL